MTSIIYKTNCHGSHFQAQHLGRLESWGGRITFRLWDQPRLETVPGQSRLQNETQFQKDDNKIYLQVSVTAGTCNPSHLGAGVHKMKSLAPASVILDSLKNKEWLGY